MSRLQRAIAQTLLAGAFTTVFLFLLPNHPGETLAQAANYMYQLVTPEVAKDGLGN